MDFHIYLHSNHDETLKRLDRVERLLSQLLQKGNAMSAALERITQEVAETKTAVESAITLINGLAQQIRDNAEDPVALNALADELDAQQAAIGEAVAANTPAE